MTLTPAHVSPFIALIAGILILIMPRFLNFIVCHLPYLDRAHGAERHLSFHPLIAQRSPHRSAIAARTKPHSECYERKGGGFLPGASNRLRTFTAPTLRCPTCGSRLPSANATARCTTCVEFTIWG